MTLTRLQAAIVILCLAGLSICAFHVGRLSGNHPAPLIVESAVVRLQDLAGRAGLSLSIFCGPHHTLPFTMRCSVYADVSGEDGYKINRIESTCEAAATEVLAALEARNVK